MKLKNQRKETFCQEIMTGKTQRQAYYVAYPNSKKWKPETADNKASALMRDGEVSARLAELQADAAKKNEITRDGLIQQLKTIGFAKIEDYDIKPNDKIKAIEVMAKLLGYDKPKEEAVTTETLVKLLEAVKNIE